MPSTEDIQSKVIELVAQAKQLEPSAITPATTFDELGMDSLDKINLTFEVEEAFDIKIPDDALNSLRTVADIVSGVERLLGTRASS